MAEEIGDDKNKQSKYNSGLLQIGRLDNIWINCKEYSVKEDYVGWIFELEAGWRELNQDAEKKSKKYAEGIQTYDKLINISFGMKKTNLGNEFIIKNKTLLRKYLTQKENFLRGIEAEAGKGGSYKDDTGEEFD